MGDGKDCGGGGEANEFHPKGKISRLHTGSDPSVFMPMLGSSSPGTGNLTPK